MDTALMFFALLWGLLGGSTSSSPAPARKPQRQPQPQAGLPPASGTKVTTPPWPQVVPSGLPTFPGSGWEFDEPPPKDVQARAAQLVQQLWNAGSGTFKTEQTGGRWISYRAEIVKSGKKGVVAYRLKSTAPKPKQGTTAAAPRPAAPAPARAPAPAPTAAPKYEATSPGLPQAPQTMATASPVSYDVDVGPATLSPIQMPDLKIGMGLKPAAALPDVALVQQKLGVTPVDGRFGKDTQTAVIVFQQKTGLAPANQTIEQLRARGFGAVKQATWVKLFAVRA